MAGIRRCLPPFAVRAPFSPGAEFKDMVIYDAMGRRKRGVLSVGIYYVLPRSGSPKRKLVAVQ